MLPAEPFDRSLGTCADWDLWIRLSRLADPVGVTRPLVGYRIHSNNMSLDTRRTIAELAQIEKRYGGPIDWVHYLSDTWRAFLFVAVGTSTPCSITVARPARTGTIGAAISYWI